MKRLEHKLIVIILPNCFVPKFNTLTTKPYLIFSHCKVKQLYPLPLVHPFNMFARDVFAHTGHRELEPYHRYVGYPPESESSEMEI